MDNLNDVQQEFSLVPYYPSIDIIIF